MHDKSLMSLCYLLFSASHVLTQLQTKPEETSTAAQVVIRLAIPMGKGKNRFSTNPIVNTRSPNSTQLTTLKDTHHTKGDDNRHNRVR